MKDNIELSEHLRQLRKNAGLSQEQLAETLDISRQAVSKWESGVSSPDAHNIVRLSKLYGVSTDSILLGESPVPETGDTIEETTDITPQSADIVPPEEEKPSAWKKLPSNGYLWGFLWATLGTVCVLVLYVVTNIF